MCVREDPGSSPGPGRSKGSFHPGFPTVSPLKLLKQVLQPSKWPCAQPNHVKQLGFKL